MISRATDLCISISESPGNTGTRIQNALYERHGVYCLYKAMRVARVDLRRAIEGVKALGIRGCSVSMPHKICAARMADWRDPVVERLGVTNTLVNVGGKLHAYNTDHAAAKRVIGELDALARARDVCVTKAIVLGAGATARSVCLALNELGFPITIANRTKRKTEWFKKEFGAMAVAASRIAKFTTQGCIVVNTTSVGMEKYHRFLNYASDMNWTGFHPECIVFDVVNRDTFLCSAARHSGTAVVANGQRMAAWQSVLQFQHYTGIELEDPEQEVEHVLALLCEA